MVDAAELADARQRNAVEPGPAPADPPSRRDRTWRRLPLSRVSIQSKLVVMLVLCTIVAAAVVGIIGFQAGRGSLRDSVFNRLTEVRQSQSRALKDQLADLKNSMIIYARSATTLNALAEFTAGFDALADKPISPAQAQSVTDYYTNTYLKQVQQASGVTLNVDQLLPKSNAQRYLQANYTAQRQDDATAVKIDDAHDGSSWSAANAHYQDIFREIVTRFEFEDAMLLDTRGNMVYTAFKDVDLGTNILTGPYNGSTLRGAYEKALSSNALDYVGFTDFEIYQPAENEPTAWMVTPIVTGGRAVGVLALQFPASKVNRLMTFDKRWNESGLGNTGESYLVGSDNLMRSDSRVFLEDPQTYKSEVIEAGTPVSVAERALRLGGTTLVQPVPAESARLAQRGESGTQITTDYLGRESLEAYAPVVIPDSDLNWSIIAKVDTSEAFEKEADFTRTMVLSTVGIIFAVCVAAVFLAQLFVRPIRRLEAGAQRISAGDYDVAIPVETRDEIGDLTNAFNEMSRSLTVKEELLVEQRKENSKLLALLMPEPFAERYQQGEEIPAEEHQNVTVIFTEIIGLDRLQAQLTSQGSLAMVTEIERQFDAAADNLGIERGRGIRNGYLGSCGLSVPRLDNVRRTVDFALECQRIIDRFNAETNNNLGLRAGIDTGTVSSGLGGRHSVVYDMWGAAVNVAYQVKSGSPQPGIDVTDRVYQALRETMSFTSVGTVTVDGREEPIWRLVEPR
ncbi:HAMP domain-containing protein [Mycobacterium sp. CBMA293]|uniref:adenylate/guanylate cyclase domain-containing protein n=1 Tax=unclassified Mycolicibacterium TaxID=2636767 RepID=UPI0012DFD548|nr:MULTISPECIES: adenylate/guanylate cyclase domain-containing protein [unclassified Mycolicibacterium]MUL46893.1 HAMP domain-containing protein [Mycolicibacterium sp. CBMA 360]MUL57321.1 HAMP domain-containing protein [Mycolicibacterium sp. CBMA 335]MUL70361.1 HAMP domain-containing protein [Mycolicibacterium sp. CBMA 311]MUL92409.1 HAMP domain-containing protein [Mycolicibacterium sp. CBMA 230]MUM04331.1 adenylate/guanylate cyclase domain-containing protein [Mycolicibacterium sp. CBMA 213]